MYLASTTHTYIGCTHQRPPAQVALDATKQTEQRRLTRHQTGVCTYLRGTHAYAHIAKVVKRRRLNNVDDRHQVLVLQMPQQLDFAANSLSVNEIVKCFANLFHRHVLAGQGVRT